MFSTETEDYLKKNIFYQPQKEFTEDNIEVLFGGLLTMTEDNGVEKEFPTTADHSVRTAAFAAELADRLGEKKDIMFQAGLLHDVGKMEIEKDILYKKGTFSPGERATMARHGNYTKRLLSMTFGKNLPEKVSFACEHHHDPDQNVFDNILYVADQLEALTSAKRTYKKQRTAVEALTIIEDFNGGALPKVLDAAWSMMKDLEQYKKNDGSYDIEAFCPESQKYMELVENITIPYEKDFEVEEER